MSEIIVLNTHIWLWLNGAKLASIDSLFSKYPELESCLM